MLLEQQAQSRLPGIDTFVAAEAFKVGNKIDGRTLNAIGWNFSEHFLSVAERHVPEMQITAWTLLYTASDKWILESLDEQPDGSTCVLANIHSLMTLGHDVLNHLDGRSNFAYVRSPVGRRLWAVHWSVNSAKRMDYWCSVRAASAYRLAQWVAPFHQPKQSCFKLQASNTTPLTPDRCPRL